MNQNCAVKMAILKFLIITRHTWVLSFKLCYMKMIVNMFWLLIKRKPQNKEVEKTRRRKRSSMFNK